MSYAIGNIIYGISPDSDITKILDLNMDLLELDGITTYYSGSSPETPIMIGSFIKSINECTNVDLTGLLSEIEDNKFEYINEFKKQRSLVLENLEDAADAYGIEESIVNEVINWINNAEPTFQIVWSTS